MTDRRVTETVLVYTLTDVPRFKWKGMRRFDVGWPSFWEEGRDVGVTVVARRRKDGQYRVVEIEIPEDAAEEDVEDILSSWWYVFPKKSRKDPRCPPVIFVWEFSGVRVVACYRPGSERWVPLSRQLADGARERKEEGRD